MTKQSTINPSRQGPLSNWEMRIQELTFQRTHIMVYCNGVISRTWRALRLPYKFLEGGLSSPWDELFRTWKNVTATTQRLVCRRDNSRRIIYGSRMRLRQICKWYFPLFPWSLHIEFGKCLTRKTYTSIQRTRMPWNHNACLRLLLDLNFYLQLSARNAVGFVPQTDLRRYSLPIRYRLQDTIAIRTNIMRDFFEFNEFSWSEESVIRVHCSHSIHKWTFGPDMTQRVSEVHMHEWKLLAYKNHYIL